MEKTLRDDKIESIIGIVKYDRKLIDGATYLAESLSTGQEQLPNQLLDNITQGVNWTVAVLNQVMDVMNEKDEQIDKIFINDALMDFQGALSEGNEIRLAEALRGSLVPALDQICVVGEQFA